MYTLHQLSNNTRVLLAPQHDTQTVTVLALFPVGSRYESADLNGASHFIEHLMFKGTKRRPTTLHISKDLDRVGAEYNAFTGKDHTGYYIKVNAKHLDLALDMLEDMLFHSVFAGEEIERERRVILEEIHLYEDNPSMRLDDIFENLIYSGHPLGRLISGTRETVLKIRRPELVNYRDRFYHPNKMVLAIAGNLEGDVLGRVQKIFGRVASPKNTSVIRQIKLQKTPRGPAVKIHWKETTQAHLALGVPTFGADDPKVYSLAVLANILGGTMSSRLFVAVRERRGLAYSIRASVGAYADTGLLTILAGLDPQRLTEAIKIILREFVRIRDRGISTEELSRAQENIEGHIVLGLEDSSLRADWYGKQALLHKDILTPEEKIAKLKAVDRGAVTRLARELLQTNRLHLALIGDFKDETKFKKLLKI